MHFAPVIISSMVSIMYLVMGPVSRHPPLGYLKPVTRFTIMLLHYELHAIAALRSRSAQPVDLQSRTAPGIEPGSFADGFLVSAGPREYDALFIA